MQSVQNEIICLIELSRRRKLQLKWININTDAFILSFIRSPLIVGRNHALKPLFSPFIFTSFIIHYNIMQRFYYTVATIMMLERRRRTRKRSTVSCKWKQKGNVRQTMPRCEVFLEVLFRIIVWKEWTEPDNQTWFWFFLYSKYKDIYIELNRRYLFLWSPI